MFQRKGTKRKASGKGRRGGFKKRRGFGSSRGPSYSSPFGPSAVQYGAGKGITDQAILYKTVGVPGRICLKLRTTYSGSLTSTSGAYAEGNLCKLNSCNDPAGAQGSIKCGGYFSWFGSGPNAEDGIYSSYIVTAAKIRVWFNAASANTVPVNVGLRFTSSLTAFASDFNTFSGQPMVVQNCVGLPAGGHGQKVLGKYATIAQVMSDSMATVAYDDSYAALMNADPASLALCNVAVQSTDASSSTTLLYRTELTQWVCMFGRKTLDAT